MKTTTLDTSKLEKATNTASALALELNAELEVSSKIKGTPLIPDSQFQQIKHQVLQALNTLPHKYHNRAHTESVHDYFTEYARIAFLTPVETQMGQVMALFHDFDHAGLTFRQLSTRPNIAMKHMSNEEVAALHQDRAVREYYSDQQRLIVCSGVLSSSFAQNNRAILPPDKADIIYRDYSAQTNLEKLLTFADISNYRRGLESFMQDNINLIHETGKAGIQSSFKEFLTAKAAFLDTYVRGKLEAATPILNDPAFSKQLTTELNTLINDVRNLSGEDFERWQNAFNVARAQRIAELA